MSHVRWFSWASGLLKSLVSIDSLTFCTSSIADSQFVVNISDASLPHVAAETLSLSVDRTRNW